MQTQNRVADYFAVDTEPKKESSTVISNSFNDSRRYTINVSISSNRTYNRDEGSKGSLVGILIVIGIAVWALHALAVSAAFKGFLATMGLYL